MSDDSDVDMTNQDSEEYEYEDSDIEYTYDEDEDDNENSFDGSNSFNDSESKQNDSRLSFSPPGSGSKKHLEYRVLDKDQLAKRKEHAISQLVEILCIKHDEAQILLRHYKWDQGKTESEWFTDEARVRDLCGIPEIKDAGKKTSDSNKNNNNNTLGKRGRTRGSNPQHSSAPGDGSKTNGDLCQICWDRYEKSDMDSLACGHNFCKICWGQFLSVSVASGPVCTEVTCPIPKCNVRVPQSKIEALSRNDIGAKWNDFMIKSFVDYNRSCKWCPKPGCQFAIEYPGGGVIDVTCPCGPYTFCFGCSHEAHLPASCSDVARWNQKNSAESENITWIMANTKKCPKCGVNIEKNQGCNHMTCRKATGGCGHEFCWLCLGDWKDHGASTGGYYNCNKYEKVKKSDKKLRKDEERRLKAKHDLDRYMHFFERFNSHNRSRKFAGKTMQDIQVKREILHEVKGYRIEETDFMVKAAKCIIDSRRVLEWTYVYGYYLENENERGLFEHNQEMLERFTESLHELVEEPLDEFVQPGHDNRNLFEQHRQKITDLLSSTVKYKENMLEGIDNGFATQFR